MQAERGFQNRAEKLNVPMSTTAVFCNKSGLNCPWCALPIGNARRRGIRIPETMSTTDCVDAGNCTVARPAAPQLFNAAADRPLPLHGAERRQPGPSVSRTGRSREAASAGATIHSATRGSSRCHGIAGLAIVQEELGAEARFRKNRIRRVGGRSGVRRQQRACGEAGEELAASTHILFLSST